MKIAMLAGTHSGCGKTTVMLALLQYMNLQAHNPRPFKVGPDFLDPLWHKAVTAKASYNLDTHMIGIDESRRLLNRCAESEGYALIEGVMGLFDGRSGVGEAGSSVDLASQLAVPVILVVDAGGMSGSIVPLASGFCEFAQKCGARIAGIIANRVGSEYHARLLSESLLEYGLPPLLGWLSKDAPRLEERHLGLKIPESVNVPDFQDKLHMNAEHFEAAFSLYQPIQDNPAELGVLQGKIIAVAKDQACCFIYPANVDWLTEQGAKLVWFSPLAGEPVPAADALWLPGGYPELHVRQLAESATLASIKTFIETGKPVLAECGGAMLLGQSLIDQQGKSWPMAEVLPFRSKMQNKLAALGYRQERSGMRGHEFHYSVRETDDALVPCFETDVGDKGVCYKNLRASYVHWYFASAPAAAKAWFT
ncbi:MAG: cobalamin biosynthesis protein CobB [Methylomonas sp.]|nr:MAG: cobalamin biosynthesis protein CobB [Methylomonas sp.]